MFAKRLLLAAAGMFAAGVLRAQTTPAAALKFEVAAIRPCPSDGDAPATRGGSGQQTPGRLTLPCTTPERLIRQAYVLFADDRYNAFAPEIPISGIPDWAKSERYQIEAKAEGPARWLTMSGAMLRALLEERFKLKLHRETREVPV